MYPTLLICNNIMVTVFVAHNTESDISEDYLFHGKNFQFKHNGHSTHYVQFNRSVRIYSL